jgi:hypothetical protein
MRGRLPRRRSSTTNVFSYPNLSRVTRRYGRNYFLFCVDPDDFAVRPRLAAGRAGRRAAGARFAADRAGAVRLAAGRFVSAASRPREAAARGRAAGRGSVRVGAVDRCADAAAARVPVPVAFWASLKWV